MIIAMRLTNPLEEDPLLKELLKQLDRIETRRGFAKWKPQFLDQFEVHLEGTNVTKAGQKYHSLAKRLDRLALLLKKMEGLISSGECSEEHCTVKARQCLTELQKALTGMIGHTESLVPGTHEMEKEVGYTKFDMGAVLVRDGFVEYDRLCICNEILSHMSNIALAKVADRQLLEEMDRYWTKVQGFYQIMGTDLGLDKAILRCRKILRAEDDEFFEITEAQTAHDVDSPRVKPLYDDDTESKVREEKASLQQHREEQQQGRPESSLPNSGHTSDKETYKKGKRGEGSLDELDRRQQPTPTPQRFERVEIYGHELPLRLIKIADDSSFTDLSSVSDYDSWCWELELPEPTPTPPSQNPKLGPPKTASQSPEGGLKESNLPSKPLEKTPPEPYASDTPPRKSNRNAEGDGKDGDSGGGDKHLRYKWTGKDYYHGADAAGWRIAGSLKKTRNKNETVAPASATTSTTIE